MADEEQTVTSIRIKLLTRASNEFPAVIADLAQDAEDPRAATAARWDAVAAANRSVMLRRVITLPAVPRVGENMYVAPYSEELQVLAMTWTADPEDHEPHVTLNLSDVDFDVIGDEHDALAWFLESGWTQEE